MSRYTIISVCEAKRDVYRYAKAYEDKAIRLARSIRANGGANIPIVMWYGSDRPPAAETKTALERLDCRLVEGVCQYPEHPVFNKTEALATTVVDTEAKLWIDTDVYVRGGLDWFEQVECDVAASPDTHDHHVLARLEDEPVWRDYCRLMGFEWEDGARMQTTIDGGVGNFYIMNGVIYMKNDRSLTDTYRANAVRALESDLPYRELWHDQVGLTTVVLQQKRKYIPLPEALNYVYALRRDINGQFIHYQDNILDNYPEIDWPV